MLRPYPQTADIFNKLRQRHSTYALGIATLELEIINISSAATESKRIACNLPFENQLFGHIHNCTEININLLLNTCNFHRKFRFIFSLNLSENRQNVQFREAKFQNFPGELAPGLPPFSRAFGARSYFCRNNSELLPPGLLLPMGNSQYNILYLNYTKGCFLFLVEKRGAPSVLFRDIYFKDCSHEVRSSLKCTSPPPRHSRKSCSVKRNSWSVKP